MAGARLKEGGRKIAGAPWTRIGIWAGGIASVLMLTLAVFLTFADWSALREPISRMASAATGREIAIRGDLRVNPWRLNPEIDIGELYIGNPRHYRERGAFAEIRRATASVRWLPLFIGRIDFVRLDLEGADISLYRDAEGGTNWAAAGGGGGRQFNLPAIRHFSLSDGRLRYEDDKRRLLLEATFTTEESRDPRNPGRFALNGEGAINARPLTVAFTGAPLLNVRRDRPYRFNADIRAGETHIVADGAIDRPFNFAAWSAEIDASGPDLAQLYPLTGLALPNTPSYALTGRIERAGARYGMREISGRVGDSDLRGAFTATRQANDRLMLEGAFESNTLHFDDALTVLGAPPATLENASVEQRQMAAQLAAEGRMLPDAKLDISRVRNMDARVSYRAAHVRSEQFPLRRLALDISLDNGLLSLDPMVLDLRQGRLAGAVAINAREQTPRVDIDVRLSNARLESVLAVSGDPPLTGALLGRARLSGAGASAREAAANANGQITLVTPNGQVREAFAELTGINVTRGLGLLLADDASKIDIRCGVASFRVERGVAHSRTILFDTETMLIQGEGTINLRNETMDLRIEGAPKEFRLIRLSAPITIGGRWRAPQVGVRAGEALGQGGLAALLASIVAPVAAVLPFVDTGLAEDANCAALLAAPQQARSPS